MLIDASRSTPLSLEQVREWADGRSFFLSSPMADTAQERAAVAGAIEASGATAIWFERIGGRSDDAERAYLSEVDRCDCLIGIYRARYGGIGPDGLSASHAEYRRAERGGKSIAAWVSTPAPVDRDPQLVALIEEVRSRHTTGAYDSVAALGAQVSARVAELAAEDVSPWVKLGDLAFRASRVRVGSEGGVLEARLRPGAVLDALVRLAEHPRHDLILTVRERSLMVRITNVTSTLESSTRTVIKVDYRIGEAPAPIAMAFSSGTLALNAEEIVALRLEQQLFDRDVPRFFVFWSDFVIDTTPLRDPALSEATVTALIRLLITEALVGGGYVGALRRIEVGPLTASGRHVRVRWQDRRAYASVEPAEREVDGDIRAGWARPGGLG